MFLWLTEYDKRVDIESIYALIGAIIYGWLNRLVVNCSS